MNEATCPVCDGTGFEIRTSPSGFTSAVRCLCDLKGRAEKLLRSTRIPRRYDHCSLDSFELQHASHESAQKIARDWAARWPIVEHGLFFLGPAGTGKTHLAIGIARELASTKGARVLFYEQRELLKDIQDTFDAESAQREGEVLGPVLEAELLILDDLGAGRTTAWVRDVMHDIITQRYNERRPILITSNRETGEESEGVPEKEPVPEGLTLRDRLGDALMSRLHEMCLIVPVQGRDYRRGVLHARHRP